jgi:hypothetical protein
MSSGRGPGNCFSSPGYSPVGIKGEFPPGEWDASDFSHSRSLPNSKMGKIKQKVPNPHDPHPNPNLLTKIDEHAH